MAHSKLYALTTEGSTAMRQIANCAQHRAEDHQIDGQASESVQVRYGQRKRNFAFRCLYAQKLKTLGRYSSGDSRVGTTLTLHMEF